MKRLRTILFGDKSKFAIESGILRAYEGMQALGFFTIYIKGTRYGVRGPEATMLGNSFEEVQRRIQRRGNHTAPFTTESDAHKIADAFRYPYYPANKKGLKFFGVSQTSFAKIVYSKNLLCAPDGDEAFDDGSYIFQFDLKDDVRLIGFKSAKRYDAGQRLLRDLLLEADEFYGILEKWRDAFETEWRLMPRSILKKVCA